MKKNVLMILVTIIVTISLCTIAAMYTPPDFGHSVTMVTSDGGVNRHPVYLGLNMDKYVILVTGTVRPPYKGGFRIALEGKDPVHYRIFSSYPPEISLGYDSFYDFKNNTISGISASDKFSVAVFIEPDVRINSGSEYKLNFYDINSGKTVLTVPVSFRELVDFSLLKTTRRPYPQSHDMHSGHSMSTASGSHH